MTTCLIFTQVKPDSIQVRPGRFSLPAMPVENGFVNSNLAGYLQKFSTPDSTLGIDAILVAQSGFQQIGQQLPNLGKDHRYHWIRFALKNTGTRAQSLVVHIQFKEVNDLSFYVVDDRNRIQYRQEKLDRRTPISQKPIFTRHFAFPLSIEVDERRMVYFRLHRKYSGLLVPVKLYSKEGFFDYLFTADMLLYFSLGIVAVACIITGILYLFTRRRLLLYYAGYCLFYGLSIGNLEGLLTQGFNINIPLLDENTNIVFLGIVDLFITLFSINFLQVSSYAPRWLRLMATTLVYCSGGFVAYAWASPFSDLNASLASLLGLVTMLVVTGMIAYGLAHRKYEAILYVVAITPLFTMAIWFAASVLVGLPRTWHFFELSHYSSLFEIIVLGAGIGYKLVWDRNKYLLELNQLQTDFTSSILQTQDMERQRIAADLHDDLGGTLATIRRSISDLISDSNDPQTLKKFENLEPLILKSSQDLRRIAHNLMPPEFDRIGLSNSVAQLVLALPAAPTQFEYLCSGEVHRLGKEIELNAYRIVSELIQNILKHAQAKQAAVQLIYFEDSLRILVEDNGLGRRTENTADQTTGLGLKNCMLRASYIGAKLTRETSEAGSLILLDIPYQPTS
ncbi:sensor histidine kinase [Dyadobacter jiangsuensis]